MEMLIIGSFIILVVIVGVFFWLKNDKKRDHSSRSTETELRTIESNDLKITDNQKDLTQITELFLKNNLGNELVFKRPNIELSTEKKYQEVALTDLNQVSGHLVNAAMPFLQETVTLNQLAKIAPNGFFTTLADPNTLSKFSDGTYSTMVRNGANHLTGHKGFSMVDVESAVVANPVKAIMASMQAMAIISGQYYLHEINAQLGKISNQLDELVNYHNDEKIGMLLTVKDRLLKIASKQNVDAHDIGEIRVLLKDSRNVYEEYRVRLARQQEELVSFDSKKFTEKNRIAALEEKIHEINFTVKIVYEADQLSLQAELSEIAVRMKLGDKTAVIKELLAQMQEHYNSSFYASIDNFVKDEYRLTVRERYRKLGKNYLLKHPERLKQINSLINLPEFKQIDSKIGDLSERLLSDQSKEREILFMPNEDLTSQRVFVATE